MRLVASCHGHEDDVEMAAFALDGSKVATCSRVTGGPMGQVFNADTGEVIY